MSAKRWTLSIIAGAVLAAGMTATIWGQQQRPTEKPAAVVNGVPISFAEIDAVIKRDGPSLVPLSEDRRRQRRLDVLEGLIEDQLFAQFLMQNAPRLEPAAIDKRMAELQDDLKKKGKTLEQFCRDTNQSEAVIRAAVTSAAQWHAYVTGHYPPADIKQYYEANREYFDGVLVRVSHIELRVPAQTSAAEKLAARNKLLAIRQDIISGKLDFAEAVKKHSQTSNPTEGGDIGFIPLKGLAEEPFARAAFALKVGEISDVVQTEFAMHLIKTTDRKQGRQSEFEAIKEEVLEQLEIDLRQSIIDNQRKTARIEINLQ